MRFSIECDCGDVIDADNKEEAIKIFCEKHNFPLPNTFKKRNDYALWLKLSEDSPCYMLPEFLATYTKPLVEVRDSL